MGAPDQFPPYIAALRCNGLHAACATDCRCQPRHALRLRSGGDAARPLPCDAFAQPSDFSGGRRRRFVSRPQAQLMAGTALIFAHLALRNAVPPAALNEELAKSARPGGPF